MNEPTSATADKRPSESGCSPFGGPDADGQNALWHAIGKCGERYAQSFDVPDSDLPSYAWLENTPRASLVVELHDALRDLGFKIVKANAGLDRQEEAR